MADDLISRVLSGSRYNWHIYKGPTKILTTKSGRHTIILSKGHKIGLRPSTSNPDKWRMIHPSLGKTIVFTLTKNSAARLRNLSEPHIGRKPHVRKRHVAANTDPKLKAVTASTWEAFSKTPMQKKDGSPMETLADMMEKGGMFGDPVLVDPFKNLAPIVASEHKDNPHLVAAGEAPPKSPTSGRPMQMVEMFSGGRPFKVWVNLDDRMVIPARAS